MSQAEVLYIAGMGVVSAVGGNMAMTAAAIKAGVSGYAASDFYGTAGEPITMALVPNELFDIANVSLDEGDRFNRQHDRIIKMAIIAAHEACAAHAGAGPIPVLLASAEVQRDVAGLASLTDSLAGHCELLADPRLYCSVDSGRAAGLAAIDHAFDHVRTSQQELICVGGSDSYMEDSSLWGLDEAHRLLSAATPDGFAPGEGAGFLVLTPNPARALQKNGCVIALHPPGLAEEPGHLRSDEVYRGDGLDQAFKRALVNHQQQSIRVIYSSMNGESYWAKELGVARIRNRQSFSEDAAVHHPADCYGDLGAATAPVLVALAAEHLLSDHATNAALVYGASDSALRGAIVVEKFSIDSKV